MVKVIENKYNLNIRKTGISVRKKETQNKTKVMEKKKD
jgi:hypothetical protein